MSEPPFPENAKRVKPRKVKTGGWVEMEIDAVLEFAGITWLRAKGGFGDGQRNDWHPREDWIAALPEVSLHVGRYWDEPNAWKKRGAQITMEQAMSTAISETLRRSLHRAAEVAGKLNSLNSSIVRLAEAAGSLNGEEA